VRTPDGTRHVWCTFSHDQVDLNFANPDLLAEMIDIVVFYLTQGVKIFRLDAIAFIWKVPGTSCLNLKQAHEIVRLLRTLIEYKDPTALIITETNIPNRENLAYFGNANEAHIIYNFALPPLLLHAIATGNNFYLNNWLMSMPPAADGTTYLNFIASHDGIGLRPIEGILSGHEVKQLLDLMESFGGRISWRNYGAEQIRAYEINISLFAALQGTVDGPDDYSIQRFICVHAIMAALEGIPAFYIHSLLATPNDETEAEALGNNRAINRHVWDAATLDGLLNDAESDAAKVLNGLKEMLSIRKGQPAFHPNATQYTLRLGDGLFAFWRQSRQRHQSIFCIHNITQQIKTFSLTDLNLIETHQWKDLLSDTAYSDFDDTVLLSPYQCMWLTNFWPK
jgi:sucrose phosphorylase